MQSYSNRSKIIFNTKKMGHQRRGYADISLFFKCKANLDLKSLRYEKCICGSSVIGNQSLENLSII
jgi:hypothetical protein